MNNRPEHSGNNSDYEEEEEEDLTCCHRVTCCCALRNVKVTRPISQRFCTQFTYASIFWLITVTAIILMCYVTLYFYVGESVLPDRDVFGLLALVVFAYFLGWALAYLPYLQLPPVFGMLLAGIIVRNLDWYNIREALGLSVSSKIRTFAATFAMLRAGLQLSSSSLRQHPYFVLVLAVIPCTVEMITVAICCHYLLDFPWTWAFLNGSIISCISPVVPVNCMLALAERGYGTQKDIASLLFTAASIDDIHIVSFYAICFGLVFTHDDKPLRWWSYIPSSLKDLLVGTTAGTILGLFFVFFPHRKHKYAFWYRICCLVLGSLMCTTGAVKIAITGGGFLATIIMSLIATTGWRILSAPFDVQPLRNAVKIMWHFSQPVLLGVIGADIDFRNWILVRFSFYVICIVIGLLTRISSAYLATHHSHFNTKERIFTALSWISKGTPQAALAPMVFEQALRNEEPSEMALAVDVVRMSIVSIVFLAPLGAMVMMLTGPLLLTKGTEDEESKQRELSLIRLMSIQPLRKRRSTS